MELPAFEPIFGEPKVEWLNKDSLLLHRFLFFVSTSDPSGLRFCVSDFHSNTWEARRSNLQLEDMRDDIGIGGTMSDFVNYISTSLKFGEVKLSMEEKSGAEYAKLTAQKSKGMPIFSVSLTKLVGSAASEAVANISLGLFNALKDMQCALAKEQERSLQLANMISAEKEKNESIQSLIGQYTKKQKLQHMKTSADADGSALLSTGLQNSPDKHMVHDLGSTKVVNRVVPAYRRAKARGALLQDSEDDHEQECSLQSSKLISDEEEKSKSTRKQLEHNTKQEVQNMNISTNAADKLQTSPDKPVVHDIGSMNITNRAVPARRTRPRGALLQDSEDDTSR